MLRLTLARRGPLALRTSRRTLCAESPAMLDQVKSAVADMKEKAEAKTSSGYETLKADIEAGTVDTAKLGAALSFSEDAKRVSSAPFPPRGRRASAAARPAPLV